MSSGMDRRDFLRLGASAAVLGMGGRGALSALVSDSGRQKSRASTLEGLIPAQRGGTLNMALPGDPGTLDFLTSTLDVLRHSIRSTVLDVLVHVGPDLKFVPGLATAWALSADAKTLTIHLRPGLKYHDGTPCTAADIAYTVSWLNNPKNGSPIAVLTANVETVQVVDALTANLHLSAPTPGLIANLTQVPIFNSQTVGTMNTHPIGLGPFKFVSYTPGENITVKRNPDYYIAGLPYLDGITWPFVSDSQSSLEDLLSGSVLAVDSLAIANLAAVQSASNTYVVESGPVNLYEVFQINTKQPPFNNKIVRQALSYAMDRDIYCKAIWDGVAQPSDTAYVSQMPSYLAGSARRYSYNLPKAEALLKSAGFDKSNPLKMNILTPEPTALPTLAAMAATLQSTLNSLGHKVTTTALDAAPWIDRIVTHPNFDVTTDNYNTVPIDPGAIITTSNYDPTNNVNQFYVPEYVHLVEAAASEANPSTRLKLYDEIQAYLLDEQPCIIVDHFPVLIGASKRVKGLVPDPIGPYDYSRVTLS